LRKAYHGSKREICAFGGVAGVGRLRVPAGAYRAVWRGASRPLLRSEHDERLRLRKESGSFLKKRTKKRLILRALASTVPKPAGQSFFASFYLQKEVLAPIAPHAQTFPAPRPHRTRRYLRHGGAGAGFAGCWA
jgi:hypothetical protein